MDEINTQIITLNRGAHSWRSVTRRVKMERIIKIMGALANTLIGVLVICMFFLLVKDNQILLFSPKADKNRGVMISCVSRCVDHEPFEIISWGVSLIQKKDYSIINDEGNVIAKIYYDMPIFIGNNASYKAINRYYEEQFANWFNGDEKKAFIEETEEMREAWGDETLSSYPFVYVVDTKIMLLSNEYVSVMQINRGQTAGPSGMYYFGDTFALDTGEWIPFDAILETDADTFRTMLAEFLEQQERVLSQPMDDVISMYKSRGDHSWELNGRDRYLNYDYFYDGKYLYLILNNSVFLEDGCLLKWNQRYGDQSETVLMNYFGESGNELYEFYYY